MWKSFLFWLHGLAAVFIGGVSSSIIVMVADPAAFNFHGQWKKTLGTALALGLVKAAAYLSTSPLPKISTSEEKTQ